jgi:hypothetical protein
MAPHRLSVVVWTCRFAGGKAVAALRGSASACVVGPTLSKDFFREQRPSRPSEPEPWGWSWDGLLGRWPGLLGSHGPVPGYAVARRRRRLALPHPFSWSGRRRYVLRVSPPSGFRSREPMWPGKVCPGRYGSPVFISLCGGTYCFLSFPFHMGGEDEGGIPRVHLYQTKTSLSLFLSVSSLSLSPSLPPHTL